MFINSNYLSCQRNGWSKLDTILAYSDIKGLYELLEKWLKNYRFGVDVEFEKEILEQLLYVQDSFEYELLSVVEIISSHYQQWKMVTQM